MHGDGNGGEGGTYSFGNVVAVYKGAGACARKAERSIRVDPEGFFDDGV